MMIWFAGLSRVLNNTCCNNVNKKNKANKKAELWVWCLLTQIRILNDVKCCICVFQSKRTNNYFFHFSCVGNCIFSPQFFELFQEWMESHLFWARPLKIANGFCFLHFFYFLDAFLKKRITPTIPESEVKCWIEGRNWFLHWCYCYWAVRN